MHLVLERLEEKSQRTDVVIDPRVFEVLAKFTTLLLEITYRLTRQLSTGSLKFCISRPYQWSVQKDSTVISGVAFDQHKRTVRTPERLGFFTCRSVNSG